MDCITDPQVEQIVVMSAAQVGKSEILLNCLFYFIDLDPGPVLMLQPTVEMAQAFSRTRIQPTIRICPTLSAKVADPKTRDSGNTILHKEGAGWTLDIAGSNSPASLSSRPVRILLLDEVDRMPKLIELVKASSNALIEMKTALAEQTMTMRELLSRLDTRRG